MRYVAVSAAVFGAATFLAPSSPASLFDSLSLTTKPNQTATALAVDKPLPHAVLASAPVATQAAAPAEAKAPEPAKPEPVTITVAAGDNLTKLAEASGITYRRLYDANPEISNPDLIYPGQQLRVPAPSEQLAERELPANAPASALAEPKQAAAIQTQSVAAPAVASGSVWDQLAQCESGGNWAINTGNGFYGGLQFTLATWQSLGGAGYPHQASREEQIAKAEALLARSGWGQWPACTTKLGLR